MRKAVLMMILFFAPLYVFSAGVMVIGEDNSAAPKPPQDYKSYPSIVLGEATEAVKGKYLYNTSLIRAIQSDAPDSVKTLIYSQISANEKNDAGYTPLVVAGQVGNMEIVKLLVEVGRAEVNTPAVYDLTGLISASANGYTQIVRYLVFNGAEIEHEDVLNKTALSHAAENGHLDTVRALLRVAADPNVIDVNGMTPLFLAIQGRHDAVARELIRAGADVFYLDKYGRDVVFMVESFLPGSRTARELKKRFTKARRPFAPAYRGHNPYPFQRVTVPPCGVAQPVAVPAPVAQPVPVQAGPPVLRRVGTAGIAAPAPQYKTLEPSVIKK